LRGQHLRGVERVFGSGIVGMEHHDGDGDGGRPGIDRRREACRETGAVPSPSRFPFPRPHRYAVNGLTLKMFRCGTLAAKWGSVSSVKTLNRKPIIESRELRNGTGWYALVTWGDRPSEQVGGFRSQDEAQAWISLSAPAWTKARLATEENTTSFDRL
jgi:hypothetical protein